MEEMQDKKKLKPMNKAMLTTHGLNNIVSLFVSTFLISYIYKISDNYILNIGLFYGFNYLAMFVFYWINSKIIDKTNRISFYRVAIVVRGIFILCVVFLGQNLAKYVVLAGILHGFSEANYWCSYNLMKNELVSKHAVGKYALHQQLIEKVVNIVVPLILGKIIDSESFKICAIIVLVIVAIQLIFSIFIKSKRPENSSFDMKSFRADVKNLKEKKKLVVWCLIISALYGFVAVIAPLNTIIIMYSFDSNFSLGQLTSIFTLSALIFLLGYKKWTKMGSRDWIYYLSAILPVVSGVLLLVNVNEFSVIFYNVAYTLSVVLYVYSYDVMRNLLLKRLGMYDDIAEYQCSIECTMELARVVIFTIMSAVGVVGFIAGGDGLIVALKILMAGAALLVSAANIIVCICERRFVEAGITED